MLTTAIFSPSAALALGLLLLQPLTSAATLPLHKKAPSNDATAAVNTTTCNGNTYTYRALAGYGSVSGSARDKFGDTLGGLGSSIAIEHGSWKRETNDSDGTELYTGILWALPDRGWNTNGTLNYNPRVHKLGITFSPLTAASAAAAADGSSSGSVSSPSNLHLEYLDTVLFSDPAGTPVTGLDPDFAEVPIEFPGFPAMPVATYEGDGFGGEGPGGRRVAVDSEGLVLGPDGEFWVSDEYGPFVYRFSREGRMLAAIRPPEAYVPRRNGNVSFSAASAPLYDPDRVPVPEDPTSGRANNQGFEGLTVSPDGSTLSVLLQSALMQDGGEGGKQTRRHARLLQYDITALSSSSSPSFPHSSSSPHSSSTNTSSNPLPKAEFVVPLPTFANADGKTRVAAQSEILALSPTQFLVLARDSNAGRAAESTESLYRHVDVFDVSAATDVFGDDDSVAGSVAGAEDGVLDEGIAPAEYCAWLDFNVGAELARFGLHNGGVDDEGLLNEKWESLAVVPVLGEGGEEVEGEWWVFSLSDDDFITQDGYMDGGDFPYSDGSGASLDNQALVFRVGLEKGLRPAGW
ncbi:putative secreted protein [Lasiodiplodia hormozganensis]|uniref:Secreted protein n=1 Tax=Lasiodiplodia hormozganensis TaxID=869390 RepID=A0AA39WNQ1_9PEZI|nr:putative secreted protein [Lasiodiplodia hormozganensis]